MGGKEQEAGKKPKDNADAHTAELQSQKTALH